MRIGRVLGLLAIDGLVGVLMICYDIRREFVILLVIIPEGYEVFIILVPEKPPASRITPTRYSGQKVVHRVRRHRKSIDNPVDCAYTASGYCMYFRSYVLILAKDGLEVSPAK